MRAVKAGKKKTSRRWHQLRCGKCLYCQAGDPRHCHDRSVLGIADRDGTFAERITLPEVNLVPVPDNVPDETAVFAEPVATALEITEQIHIGKADRVLVLGDGPLRFSRPF